jgi:phage gpG-like protein
MSAPAEAKLGGVVLHGVDAFEADLDRLTGMLAAATGPATAKAAHLIERRTKQKLKLTAHKKGAKTPSAPGQPPSTVSGTLARSVQVDGPEEIGFGHYVAAVGPTVVYGRVQELGGKAGNGSTLPARPFLNPTAEESADDVRKVAVGEWAKVLNEFRS